MPAARPPERLPLDVLAAVAIGGVLGAEARYGLGRVVSAPWGTLLINVLGCGLIGALTAVVATGRPHRLVRPLLGTGVLGGFTTFSTFAVDTDRLGHGGRALEAVGYLAATVAACLLATSVALTLTARALGRRRPSLPPVRPEQA
ncbi:MAG: fluoride efflux transporter FluC [Jatrophihabitans sp.]|uniref:fluoride efflux transporter FluC n=1 Tax=Jatrophihabitans sp. TaxID=1932789 RepID=UPI003F810FB0